MKKQITISLALAVSLLALAQTPHKPVVARVAGLERDSVYMSLLGKEQELLSREDSLVGALAQVRAKFRDNPSERSAYSTQILALEQRIFDIRNQTGIVTGRINTIEQEWVINNLSGHVERYDPVPVAGEDTAVGTPTGDFWNDPRFGSQLPESDRKAYYDAVAKEQPVVNFIKIYRNNYNTIKLLAEDYAIAPNAPIADSIYGRYKVVNALNNRIADTLASLWTAVFDNKIYTYNYLLDKMNRTAMLSDFEQKVAVMRQSEAEVRGTTAADVVAFYPIEKRVLLEYEIALAELFGSSRDSLAQALSAVAEYTSPLPEVRIEERVFIDYVDAAVSSQAKYTARNPIPEAGVYRKGSWCRILLATYQKAQVPTVFKGLFPLSYLTGEDGRYSYFAGCYPSRESAQSGLALAKRVGFRNAAVAEWVDGERLGVSGPGAADGALYRIEIESADDDLKTAVKAALAENAPGRDIARIAAREGSGAKYVFIVGSFDSKEAAQKAAAAVRHQDETLTVRTVEIEE